MLKSCLTVALLHCAARAYYLPGAAPQEFSVGAPIPIFATKMTSVKTQLPFRYFHLKFCAPTANDEQYQSNLGELLKGDVNELTAYSLEMQVPKACQVLCQQLWQPADRRRYIEAIDDEYVVHLTADNLPAATKMPGDSHVSVGLPLGSLTVNHNHLVYNHLDITIRVHPMDAGRTARVVGFEVVPKSILHENMKELHCDSQLRPTIVEELKPRDDVVFTYSVEFVESPKSALRSRTSSSVRRIIVGGGARTGALLPAPSTSSCMGWCISSLTSRRSGGRPPHCTSVT
eukprot:Polyplicarium_translucidae@DN2934_c0_g1_i11.p1